MHVMFIADIAVPLKITGYFFYLIEELGNVMLAKLY